MMRLILPAIFAIALHAQAPAASDPWKQLDFLIGKWRGVAGEKDTPLGAGQGDFSFEAELKRHIIVRRNAAAYNSGVTHDDLMIIYLDAPPTAPPRAIYFDTEGHVIRYTLSFPAANRVLFESESGQPGPAYRLTYWLEGASLNGKFEVGGKTYMSWTSNRIDRR